MTHQLQILIAHDGETEPALLEDLVVECHELVVLDFLDITGPASSRLGVGDALVVAVADFTSRVREFVSHARRQHPGRPIVLLAPPEDGEYVSYAFESGVDDIVELPAYPASGHRGEVARELVFALEKALVRRRGTGRAAVEGTRRVICVLGMKGGSGKTLTAANLGVVLALAGRSVALVDLDLQFGDLALAMGLAPERTMYDLVRAGGSLDAEKLAGFLVPHHSGAQALLAPVRPDQAATISIPFLAEVQRLLTQMFEFVVIDTPPSFTPEVISAIDGSSDVALVAMRDTLSLKNAKLALETLERMNYDRARVRIVLNRANSNVGIEREDVLAILGRDADVLVPSHRDITRSINQGAPIALQRGTDAARAFRRLAEPYLASSSTQPQPQAEPQPEPQSELMFSRRSRLPFRRAMVTG